jgi:hypothetical protein
MEIAQKASYLGMGILFKVSIQFGFWAMFQFSSDQQMIGFFKTIKNGCIVELAYFVWLNCVSCTQYV